MVMLKYKIILIKPFVNLCNNIASVLLFDLYLHHFNKTIQANEILFKLHPDSAGFFTSMLCAIHCSAVPLLISTGLLSSSTWLHNHAIDWVVICTGIVIASYALVGDFLKTQKL